MALNKIFQSTQALHRARPVPVGTVAGTPLLIEARPAVTLTDRGDATRTESMGGITVTWPSGGASLEPDQASCAFDGTFEFAVAGATTSTKSEVEVYFVAADGTLTLTKSTNAHYGWTDYPEDFRKEAGRAAVRIGA